MKSALIVGCLLLATPALGQNSFPTPGGASAGGWVNFCVNSASIAVPCGTTSSIPINITGPATTQLIAAPSPTTQAIYITHWDAQDAVLAGTFQLVYGTGVNCASGQVAITGAYNWTPQSGVQIGAGFGVIYPVPAGNAVCATTTGATSTFNGGMGYFVR